MSDDIRKTLVSGTGIARAIGVAGSGTGDATIVVSHPWWKILSIRVARIYFQTFAGFLIAQGIGVIDVRHAVDTAMNQQWGTFLSLAYVSLMPTVVGGVQNLTEFLTKLDQTNPLIHG